MSTYMIVAMGPVPGGGPGIEVSPDAAYMLAEGGWLSPGLVAESETPLPDAEVEAALNSLQGASLSLDALWGGDPEATWQSVDILRHALGLCGGRKRIVETMRLTEPSTFEEVPHAPRRVLGE